MTVTPVVPEEAIREIREAKAYTQAIMSEVDGDSYALAATLLSAIDYSLSIFWEAAYSQDKELLLETVQAALDACDLMGETHGPDVSKIRSRLASAQVNIQNWVVDVI